MCTRSERLVNLFTKFINAPYSMVKLCIDMNILLTAMLSNKRFIMPLLKLYVQIMGYQVKIMVFIYRSLLSPRIVHIILPH